jgi:hypothetical protein
MFSIKLLIDDYVYNEKRVSTPREATASPIHCYGTRFPDQPAGHHDLTVEPDADRSRIIQIAKIWRAKETAALAAVKIWSNFKAFFMNAVERDSFSKYRFQLVSFVLAYEPDLTLRERDADLLLRELFNNRLIDLCLYHKIIRDRHPGHD